MEGQGVNIETWCGNLQYAQTEGQEKTEGLLCQWHYNDLMQTNIFSKSQE